MVCRAWLVRGVDKVRGSQVHHHFTVFRTEGTLELEFLFNSASKSMDQTHQSKVPDTLLPPGNREATIDIEAEAKT